MSERASDLMPPDWKEDTELPRFQGGPPEEGSACDDWAFVDLDWQKRKIARVQFDTALWRKMNLAKSKLRDVSLRDVRIHGCDLSNADGAGIRTSRVEIVSSRLTGLVAAEGTYENTLFQDCRADYSVFQLSTFERCCFENCSLVDASFEAATLKQVVFKNCDLRNARFFQAGLLEVDLRGSMLEGLGIALDNLRGVTVDRLQTPAIAALTGVRIVDG